MPTNKKFMNKPPFRIEHQLCHSLELVVGDGGTRRLRRTAGTTPSQGLRTLSRKDYLPGEPNIPLNDKTIAEDLEEEFATRDLDRLTPWLWLVATQSSSHISSLTHQRVRGRQIIITENPGLHLVWHYNRVFVKPLPKYLLSHTFWTYYFLFTDSPIPEPQRTELRQAALGFLRSYMYLIQRRSDFDLAVEHGLLPKKIKYADFIRLIRSLGEVDDSMVSPRYSFGELRLSRLNIWIKVALFRFTYFKSESQYMAYFGRMFGPIVAFFAVFSVLLNAMQVALSALPYIDSDVPTAERWREFAVTTREFSIFSLYLVAAILMLTMVVFAWALGREAVFALKDLYRKRRQRKQGLSSP
ncbi:hypothetical protein VTJ04DRAFT_8587 [Mycothermus thermophilus]|uniref:uncharacterized protein n=1 Tax=Humicola insolens TaxID=85995 RepID=UPI003743DE44